ncbi:MAG: PLP-dependent aminotransferase family protein [Gaiellaceae bacterium]
MISFARGAPAPECIDVALLADCARMALERDGAAALAYGPPGGYGPLREWLAERHGVEPGRVLLTNGGLQGIELVARVLLARRGHVAVEAPTYDRTLTILARLQAKVVPGLDAVDGAAFLYTIPTFQNPSGTTLGPEQRRRLAELALDDRVIVLEDDPYALVRFEGERLPTIHELAGGKNVVYASSFAKTVAPGLRVGYFVLPAELVAPVEAEAVATYISPVLIGQATVWELIRRGGFEPNLERIRGLLRARRDAMLAALERDFPAGTSWSRPQGGYFLWAELGRDTAELLARAEEAGVAFVKGSDFFPGGQGGRTAARLAYSFVSPEEIDEGIARVGRLL